MTAAREAEKEVPATGRIESALDNSYDVGDLDRLSRRGDRTGA
jgi:hypothetical protein